MRVVAVACIVVIATTSICGDCCAPASAFRMRRARSIQLAFAPPSVRLHRAEREASKRVKPVWFLSPQLLQGLRAQSQRAGLLHMSDGMGCPVALPHRLEELAKWIGASEVNESVNSLQLQCVWVCLLYLCLHLCRCNVRDAMKEACKPFDRLTWSCESSGDRAAGKQDNKDAGLRLVSAETILFPGLMAAMSWLCVCPFLDSSHPNAFEHSR